MKRKTATLCLIARDNESTIESTIKSALAMIDEIVVIDLGSSDKTVVTAQSYGAKVLKADWLNDFSAIRNAAMAEATSDWILMMDPGEELAPIRPVEFKKLISKDGVAGFKISVNDNGVNKQQVKLFRNHPFVRYQYPVFEKIEVELFAWAQSRGLSVPDSEISIDCSSVDKKSFLEQQKTKLLPVAKQQNPGNPYYPYLLGSTNIQMHETEALPVYGIKAAVAELQSAWDIIQTMPIEAVRSYDWSDDLIVKLVAGKIALKDCAAAMSIISRGLEMMPTNQLLRLWRGVVTVSLSPNDSVLLAKARSDFNDCLHNNCDAEFQDKQMWKNLYASLWLGRLSLLEDKIDEAHAHFSKCLAIDPCSTGSLVGLGNCEELADNKRRALNYYLRTVNTFEMVPEAWYQGSNILKELGFNDNAKSWLSKANQLFPEYCAEKTVKQLQPV